MTREEPVVRAALPEDVPALLELIRLLAVYEKLEDEVRATPELVRRSLFGDPPCARALLAETGERPVGMAVYFFNYSTFLSRPGLYLEDLFVRKEWRGRGLGRLLLQCLARIAVERRCGRFEWAVLDWNTSAIGFYREMGAELLDSWRICRLSGERLRALAGTDDLANRPGRD